MMACDPAAFDWVKANVSWLQSFHIAGVMGAILVVVIGRGGLPFGVRWAVVPNRLDLGTGGRRQAIPLPCVQMQVPDEPGIVTARPSPVLLFSRFSAKNYSSRSKNIDQSDS